MERFLQEKKKREMKLSGKVYRFAAVTSEREKVEEFAVRVLAMLSKIRKRFCSSSSSCHSFSSSSYYFFLKEVLLLIILVLRNWLVFYSENRMNVEKDIYIEKLGLT